MAGADPLPLPPRIFALALLTGGLLLAAGCGRADQPVSIIVSNPTALVRNDEGVSVPLGKLPAGIVTRGMALKDSNGHEIPFQLDDLNGDGKPDELFFQVSLGPSETTSCICYVGEKPRQRVLKCADARLFAKDEPGLQGGMLESEWVAYAMFGPQALHVYGKRKPAMMGLGLLAVEGKSTEGGNAWDYLKVGLGMGGGSVFLDDNTSDAAVQRPFANLVRTGYRLVASGPLRGIIDVQLRGWQAGPGLVDLDERLEIHAHQRYLKARFHGAGGLSGAIHFGVGIAPLPGQERSKLFDDRFVMTAQSFLATASGRPPSDCFLASAVIFQPRDLERVVPSAKAGQDHLIYLRKPDYPVTVYFVHAWDRDGRYTSAAEWHGYVAQLAERLDNPLDIWISK